MYKVVKAFNGKEENRQFGVGDLYKFEGKRAENLSALGYIVKVAEKKKADE